MEITFKKNKGIPNFLVIDWEVVDLLGLSTDDEVDFKNLDGKLFMYRLNPLGPRFGTGVKISKSHQQQGGLIAHSRKLRHYGNPDESFEIDPEYIWDEVNEVELYEVIKN